MRIVNIMLCCDVSYVQWSELIVITSLFAMYSLICLLSRPTSTASPLTFCLNACSLHPTMHIEKKMPAHHVVKFNHVNNHNNNSPPPRLWRERYL
eukprot:m.33473 g.33473  ORF g.33473 m.33473 type:complete len:95 (-) comp9623_c0_seq2:922-1206(-)